MKPPQTLRSLYNLLELQKGTQKRPGRGEGGLVDAIPTCVTPVSAAEHVDLG